MKRFLFIAFVFMMNLTFGQNQKDVKGRKQGPWQEQYTDSKALV